MKKMVSLLLVLSVFFAFSCSSDVGSSNDSTVDTTGEPSETVDKLEAVYREREDKLPELDLGNQTINFLSMSGKVYDKEITVEELMSESLNDSIYYRNIYVEELLNCKMKFLSRYSIPKTLSNSKPAIRSLCEKTAADMDTPRRA